LNVSGNVDIVGEGTLTVTNTGGLEVNGNVAIDPNAQFVVVAGAGSLLVPRHASKVMFNPKIDMQ